MNVIRSIVLVSCLVCAYSSSLAQNITFEPDSKGLLPDGSVAVDDMAISNQFLRSGVTFGLDADMDGYPDSGSYPVLEKSGYDGTDAFQSTTDWGGPFDYAEGGTSNQLGQFFLRTAAVNTQAGSQTLLITYQTPVKQASGEIWDLDAYIFPHPSIQGYEQWMVEALDNNKDVIANIVSPQGIDMYSDELLDGKPWPFEVTAGENEEISALRFVYTGSRENSIGLAFNNFSPAQQLATTNVIGVAKICPAVEIFWHTQLGKTYQLQWTMGLGGQWHNVGGAVTGTGFEVSVLESKRLKERRMYRVLETN